MRGDRAWPGAHLGVGLRVGRREIEHAIVAERDGLPAMPFRMRRGDPRLQVVAARRHAVEERADLVVGHRR